MSGEALDDDWSVPETAVMDAIGQTIGNDYSVLATIVAVKGSAYRQPGAKMVISGAGAGVGSITAGCLEDEVRDLAASVSETGRPILKSFDLTSEDDVWGLGLGCNGIIDILLEPLGADYRPVVDAYRDGTETAVLTVLDSETDDLAKGDRLLAADGEIGDTAADGWPAWLLDALATPVVRLLSNGQSETVTVEHEGATARVFIDAVTPPPRLVVFGSGHDIRPVVELARNVDFRVTVVGFRGAKATPERFPAADRVCATAPADVRDALALNEETYAVVMTHNFLDDRIVLEELLATEVPYIGLMGPLDRFQEMLEGFEDEGLGISEADLARIYTPIGLNLGGGTPYDIALSIVAEVQAVSTGRKPMHLREREAPIHDRLNLDLDG